ncbi:tyrosine-protein phosphatase siw14 [Rhinocladiella similis]
MSVQTQDLLEMRARVEAAADSLAALDVSSNPISNPDDKSQPPTPDGSGRPVNFQVIAPGLYRSSYPMYAHFDTLADLELKTIITLVASPIPFDYANFITSNGITHYQIPIQANKDPKIYSPEETVNKVLNLILDPSNYPMLIHCNKGRHRTGTMVACFRKVTGWTLEDCIEEYERYARPKDRPLDKIFIERYNANTLKALALERGYVGGIWRAPVRSSTKSSVYTNNTLETATTSDESECPPNDYQERAKKENDAILESARRWSYK